MTPSPDPVTPVACPYTSSVLRELSDPRLLADNDPSDPSDDPDDIESVLSDKLKKLKIQNVRQTKNILS